MREVDVGVHLVAANDTQRMRELTEWVFEVECIVSG